MAVEQPPVQKKDGSVNEKALGPTTHEQASGLNQRNPHPNENIVNRPYSLSDRERFGDGTDADANAQTESTGVSQGHSHPQAQKHGHGAEGSGSTGLPEGEDSRNPSSDHNPRTQEAHGGDAHGRDVANQSHTGSTAQRNS